MSTKAHLEKDFKMKSDADWKFTLKQRFSYIWIFILFTFGILFYQSSTSFNYHYSNQQVPQVTQYFIVPNQIASILNVYNFSNLEHPKFWRNGNHGPLLELLPEDEADFLKYKEAQFLERRARVKKQCQKLQKLPDTSQTSMICQPAGNFMNGS